MRFLIALTFIFTLCITFRTEAATLDDIWKRGEVICGVDEQHYGFAFLNGKGEWQGFDVDYCRALAAAALGDANKVSYIPLNAQTRFSALQSGDVDVLFRSTTWTYTRDATLGFDFPGVTFYDQLGVMAHKSVGKTKFEDVSKGTLCVAAGTTTLDSVREYTENTGKPIKVKVFNSREGLNNFFFSGQCNLYAADQSALTTTIMTNAPNPDDYVLLETHLSKEPLGPVVRGNDREWYEIVKWLTFGLIEAEERLIKRENVETMKGSEIRAVRFMLGVSPGLGKSLRLQDDWLFQALKASGNYGEIFERNLGQSSPLKMKRGLNALWKDGGLMYSMPIR